MAASEIIVFGSINLDLVFAMDELPGPAQTRLAGGFSVQPGGKGANQAVAARRDGAVVHMVGAVGTDELAAPALRIMAETSVDLGALRRISGASTGCASVATDRHGRNQISVALGANALLSADDLPDRLLKPANLLVLQMEAAPDAVAACLRRAAGAGLAVILNLAPAVAMPPDALRCARLIVVNEDEAEALAAQLGCAPDAARLHKALGVVVIRTLGARGAETAGPQGVLQVAAPQVAVTDTTAAGDCFVGTLAAALCRRAGLENAIRRACLAAALACTVAGSQRSLPSSAQIDAFARRLGVEVCT